MSAPDRIRSVGGRLILGAGLILVWMLLWGQFTWLAFITGALLAAGVSFAFYLPAVQLTLRVNPWYCAVFVGRLLFDICRASLGVAWLVLKPHYRPSNAVLAIPLRTRSDIIMVWTAESITIVPGSFVVDFDREDSVLYVHVINVRDAEEMAAFEDEVIRTERRIALAVGTSEDVERVRAGSAASATAGGGSRRRGAKRRGPADRDERGGERRHDPEAGEER